LMEALAAGETPSPELVASAGGCGKLSMVGGGALLIAIIAGLILIALADRRVRLSERLELRLPPQVLEHQARSIIEGLGYTDPPRDRARGFGWRHDLLQVIEENDSSAERWQRLGEEGADVLRFWYRQSPRLMIPDTDSGRLLVWKPPVIQPGMVSVTLTSTGRLATFQAVPPRRTRAEGKPAELDWSIALEAAGFQPEQLEAAEPSVTPLTACDRRVAWSAPHPTLEGVRQRIDAASFQGRPVSFLVHETWTLPGRAGGSTRSFFAAMSDWAYNILLFIALVGGIWFAWSNISQGRGDRRGATRVAVYYLLLSSIVWLLTADHVSDAAGEIVLLVRALSRALFHAMLAWFLYVALEPTVRRIWPRKLVSWNRLLSGRLRDPLVGRDLLLGIAAGVATTLVLRLHYLAVGWLGAPPPRPLGMGLDFLLGPRHVIGKILWLHAEAALGAVIGVFIFVAALTVAKRPWVGLAILLVVGIARIPYGVVSDLLAVDICFRALAVACLLAGIQIGLLGLAAGLFTHFLLESSVLSLNPDAWYSASGLTAAAVLIGFALVDALCACRGRSGFPAPAPAAPPLSAAGLEPGKR
ncbi:MAG: hypothetical protein ACE5GW_04145, partial [Planctomycetota bacterium]